MEKKLTNKSKENIIYLSEDDARALGIVEVLNQFSLTEEK